ncbi:hypothetical protein Tco_1458072 [Tanacetum coccineum]
MVIEDKFKSWKSLGVQGNALRIRKPTLIFMVLGVKEVPEKECDDAVSKCQLETYKLNGECPQLVEGHISKPKEEGVMYRHGMTDMVNGSRHTLYYTSEEAWHDQISRTRLGSPGLLVLAFAMCGAIFGAFRIRLMGLFWSRDPVPVLQAVVVCLWDCGLDPYHLLCISDKVEVKVCLFEIQSNGGEERSVGTWIDERHGSDMDRGEIEFMG